MNDACESLHRITQMAIGNIKQFLDRAEKGGRDWWPINGLKFDPDILIADARELEGIAASFHQLRKRMKEVA